MDRARADNYRSCVLEGPSSKVHSFAMSPALRAVQTARAAATVDRDGTEVKPAPSAELERAYEQWADYVWRMLQRLGVHSADLEDLCHDVFLVAHRCFGEFDRR